MLFNLLRVYSLAISDCTNIIQFAISLGLDLISPERMNSIRDDCCDYDNTGVQCINGVATKIEWTDMNLNGTIETIYIPPNVTSLYLYGNLLSGSIPGGFPEGLQNLGLSNNKLTGNFPILPESLSYLSVGNNLLSGRISFNQPFNNLVVFGADFNNFSGEIAPFPKSLKQIFLTHNLLNGSFPTLPVDAKDVRSGFNYFTGSFPSPFPTVLAEMYLHENLFSGDLPTFPNSLKYVYLNTVNAVKINRFTGSMVLSSPGYFRIPHTFITDLIVWDPNHIENCDISDTPLYGNPHIRNLTICAQTGLYNASSLPQTKLLHATATPSTKTGIF